MGVVFESDFSDFPYGTFTTQHGNEYIPGGVSDFYGWTGYQAGAGTDLTIVDDQAETKVCRLDLSIGGSSHSPGMRKKLPQGVALPEAYIRYRVRWSDGWQVGQGNGGGPGRGWKWLRAWQNVGYEVPGTIPTNGSHEFDRGWTILNMRLVKGGTSHWKQRPQIWQSFKGHLDSESTVPDSDPPETDPTVGSVGGPSCTSTHGDYTGAGDDWFMESHTGVADPVTAALPGGQTYHTLEFRLKLATPGQNDGLLGYWVDGIPQVTPSTLWHSDLDKLPTVAERAAAVSEADAWVAAAPSDRYWTEQIDDTNGFNWFAVFANMSGIPKDWSSQHYLYLADWIVSTDYIGPDYRVSDVGPSPGGGGDGRARGRRRRSLVRGRMRDI